MKTHAEIMAQLPVERQQAIKKKAQELIAGDDAQGTEKITGAQARRSRPHLGQGPD